MRKLTAVLAAGLLTMAMTACGGDDDDAGDTPASAGADEGGDNGGGGDDQQKAADKLIDAAGEADIELDEDCVRDKASQLSDEDAKTILEAGDDETPTLSPEGEQLTTELFSCISREEIIDQAVSGLPEEQADCVRDALEDADLGEFTGGDTPPEFTEAITKCVSGG